MHPNDPIRSRINALAEERADKTAHEATAAAMAEARYSGLKPTAVEKDRDPHRWGVGGPGIPGRLGRRVQTQRPHWRRPAPSRSPP